MKNRRGHLAFTTGTIFTLICIFLLHISLYSTTTVKIDDYDLNSSKTSSPVTDIDFLPRAEGNYLNVYHNSRFAEPIGWYNAPIPLIMTGPLSKNNKFNLTSCATTVSSNGSELKVSPGWTKISNVKFYQLKQPDTFQPGGSNINASLFDQIDDTNHLRYEVDTKHPDKFRIVYRYDGGFPFVADLERCSCKKCGEKYSCDAGCPMQCSVTRLRKALYINVTSITNNGGITYNSGFIPINIQIGTSFQISTTFIYILAGVGVVVVVGGIYYLIRKKSKKYKIEVI
jgi:hypothetical protein